MPGRANDLIVIPDSFWQRDQTTAALRNRDVGRLFDLLRQYAGASQTQIGMACGMNQGKVSAIARGIQQVETLAVFERIADGLAMPDPARLILGLAPRATSRPSTSARQPAHIPPRDTGSAMEATPVSDLLSLSPEDGQEEEDPVRRRTFVGLTGASILGAMFADPARPEPPVGGEPLAPVLTSHAPRYAASSPRHRGPHSSRQQHQTPVPGVPVLRADQEPSRLAGRAARRLPHARRARPGCRRIRCPPTRTTSPPGSCSSSMTRALPTSPPTAACAPPRPAKIRSPPGPAPASSPTP